MDADRQNSIDPAIIRRSERSRHPHVLAVLDAAA